ncbi:MAG: hypothetical protein J1F33_03960 [Clostridiales bacterium]|nr:hypothetical protein [Clostridiales bacterium]
MKKASIKNICSIVSASLCAVFAIGNAACGISTTSIDESQNELALLLSNYQQSFELYEKVESAIKDEKEIYGNDPVIGDLLFICDYTLETIVTGKEIVYTHIVKDNDRYAIEIRFTESGALMFDEVASSYNGETVTIAVEWYDFKETIMCPTVYATTKNKSIHIYGNQSEEDLIRTQFRMAFGYIRYSLPREAEEYNSKRELYNVSGSLFPIELPTEAPFTDVSDYIEKLKEIGFNI